MHIGKHWTFLLSATSLAGWVALAIARGRFWQATLDGHVVADRPANSRARVDAIVPARNEAPTVGAAIASLAAQRYEGRLAITLVDDRSSDGTGLVALAAVAEGPERARLTVVEGRKLEAPWTGKLNALDAGLAFVRDRRGSPDYWLFTDADIEHDPNNVAELVAKAERDGVELVSLMVRLRCESRWEKLLVPAFIFFFAKLYPFAWSNESGRSTAAAAGGCVLVRAEALERIGGLPAIADRLIDDCALAAAIKGTGGRTWLGLTSKTWSIRRYETLEPFWSMVKRSAFTQLDRSYSATVVATLTMIVLYVVPPAFFGLAILRRDARLASVAGSAWALMSMLYLPTLRAYDRPLREAFALPFAAALYMAMTVDSALAHARGRGGEWKGRTYARSSGAGAV
ncbi:MAG: glycosyltransferase [Candidatus Eremiobacteraeota bacterium]|nr:glycosyltransferase [Candidatus Eremiobacteraeota bacterium]